MSSELATKLSVLIHIQFYWHVREMKTKSHARIKFKIINSEKQVNFEWPYFLIPVGRPNNK